VEILVISKFDLLKDDIKPNTNLVTGLREIFTNIEFLAEQIHVWKYQYLEDTSAIILRCLELSKDDVVRCCLSPYAKTHHSSAQ